MNTSVATIVSSAIQGAVEMNAGNETTTAFFKAYTKVAPKIKKAKSKEALALVEEATSAMNKLSRFLGKRGDGKKGGFNNIKHAPKHKRVADEQ